MSKDVAWGEKVSILEIRAGCARAAEIDTKIFGLQRPAATEGKFTSCAGGPAETRVAKRCRFRRRKNIAEIEVTSQLGDRRAAGGIEQPARGGEKADAAADRCKPVRRD